MRNVPTGTAGEAVSRRAFLRTTASATIATTAAGGALAAEVAAIPSQHPDTELIALGAEFDSLFVEYKRLDGLVEAESEALEKANPMPKGPLENDHPYWKGVLAWKTPFQDAETATGMRMEIIVQRMWELPAATVAGFAAKARTLRFTQFMHGDKPEPMIDWDWDEECLERFIRDIEVAAGGRASA